jgi:hypothetical protein
MIRPSKILTGIAMLGGIKNGEPLMRIAEALEKNGERITIAAEQTVQDIEPEDIMVGAQFIRMRNIDIPIASLRVEARMPHALLNIDEARSNGFACVLSYGGTHGDDRKFLTIVGRADGNALKALYTEEAIDVAATHSLNVGTNILLLENASTECTLIDPNVMRVDESGVYLGAGHYVTWNDISALTIQDTLSIAVGRSQMLTISES